MGMPAIEALTAAATAIKETAKVAAEVAEKVAQSAAEVGSRASESVTTNEIPLKLDESPLQMDTGEIKSSSLGALREEIKYHDGDLLKQKFEQFKSQLGEVAEQIEETPIKLEMPDQEMPYKPDSGELRSHSLGAMREGVVYRDGDILTQKMQQFEEELGDIAKHIQEKTAEDLGVADEERIKVEEKETRELTDEEKQYLKDTLGWSDKQIEKYCTIDDDGVIHYRTDNCEMEGKTSETGVEYERRTIEINGVKIEGVFPKFDSVFDTELPAEKCKSRAYAAECNKNLKEAIQNDPDLRKQFTEEQLKNIEEGHTPTGYVWHHNEETGKMQLVKESDHRANRHTGGNALWGPDSVDKGTKGESF